MQFTQWIVFSVYVLSILSMIILIITLNIGARKEALKFIVLILALVLWQLPQYMAQFLFKNKNIELTLIRSSIFISGFVPLAMYSFVKERVNVKNSLIINTAAFISIMLGVINSILNGNTLIISVSKNGIAVTSNTPLYLLLTLSIFISLIYSIFLIQVEIKKHKNPAEALKFLRYALLFAVSLNIIGFLLGKYTWSQSLTPLSLALFAGITYFAIFRHKLFDIKLIVARAVSYILTLLVLAGIFTIVTYLIINLLFGDKTFSTNTTRLIYTVLAVLVALTFPPLRLFFNKISNKVFYKDAYDPQLFIDDFNKVLVSNYEIHPLLSNAVKVIEENLKPTYTAFGLKEVDERPSIMIGSSETIKFAEEDIKYVRKMTPHMDRKIIIVDELEPKYKDLQKVLRSNDVALIARIATQYDKEDLGYLVVGSKKSGDSYNSQDIRVIEILANELVIAIQNSLRFEEIQGFNATLQQKVNDATYKLRRANERLKILDETKDDFISMASHQLRTPLTSIKGYLSMVLEGDAGKVNTTQQDMLGQAFFSSQRMVYLIADMLNVSRLKTGKFAIESSVVNLSEVVEQEMQQLKDTAEAHDVHLTYNKPKDFPDLMMDETKIRQVVMNFVDNAIYYTPKNGHIIVDLKNNHSTIELTVKDEGIGVPNSEKHHLFTKFYRAGNARKVRPDGTGLGLYMAKKVIMAQGGSIIFESEEGKGSKFGFIFSKDKLAVSKIDQANADHTRTLHVK